MPHLRKALDARVGIKMVAGPLPRGAQGLVVGPLQLEVTEVFIIRVAGLSLELGTRGRVALGSGNIVSVRIPARGSQKPTKNRER